MKSYPINKEAATATEIGDPSLYGFYLDVWSSSTLVAVRITRNPNHQSCFLSIESALDSSYSGKFLVTYPKNLAFVAPIDRINLASD